jgi:hypothetical protein
MSGTPPKFTGVARWPGQESAVYEEKVPSVLIYDAGGQVCDIVWADLHKLITPLKLVACGAEAASREKEFEAEENEWSYVENFKMHLHTAAILQKNNLPLKGSLGISYLASRSNATVLI